MKIFLASDHAGYKLKQDLLIHLSKKGFSARDLGTMDANASDYPDYAIKLCNHLLESADPDTFGVLVCGTGIGMSIAANRRHGIRAAVCNDGPLSAQYARAHNNANILCLGARLISPQVAMEVVDTFLATPFEGGRHQIRIEKIDQLS